MRRMALAVAVMAMLVGNAARTDAATITVLLNNEGSQEIEIPIDQPPTEFDLLDSSWGHLTLDGNLVAYYVFSRQDKLHAGNQLPTNYPNPEYTIAIRVLGAPTQVLMLSGVARPEVGGGAVGGVTVATGPLAFLRGATFTLVSGVLTFTF